MSVVYVSGNDAPIPTEASILSERLVLLAMKDHQAGLEFEGLYTKFVEKYGPALRRALGSKRASQFLYKRYPPVSIESSREMRALFTPWCLNWLGPNRHVVAHAVILAVLRCAGFNSFKLTPAQRAQVFSSIGWDVDSDIETLHNPDMPRAERNARKLGRAKLAAQHFRKRQHSALDK